MIDLIFTYEFMDFAYDNERELSKFAISSNENSETHSRPERMNAK